MKSVHYVILALSALVSICGYVGATFPQYATVATLVAGLAAQLGGVLGVLSGSAVTPAPALSPAVTTPAINVAKPVQGSINVGPATIAVTAADAGNLAALQAAAAAAEKAVAAAQAGAK